MAVLNNQHPRATTPSTGRCDLHAPRQQSLHSANTLPNAPGVRLRPLRFIDQIKCDGCNADLTPILQLSDPGLRPQLGQGTARQHRASDRYHLPCPLLRAGGKRAGGWPALRPVVKRCSCGRKEQDRKGGRRRGVGGRTEKARRGEQSRNSSWGSKMGALSAPRSPCPFLVTASLQGILDHVLQVDAPGQLEATRGSCH